MEDFETAAGLAFRLRVSVDTIRRDCRAGRIPQARKVGNSWIMPREVADEYAKNYVPYARQQQSGPAVGATDPQDTSPSEESNQ